MTLFATGGEIAANPGKDARSRQRAEAPRDLLFDLDHADVLLPLVVGEGHGGIHQERQHAQVVIFQTVQQVGRFALGRAPTGMIPTALAQEAGTVLDTLKQL